MADRAQATVSWAYDAHWQALVGADELLHAYLLNVLGHMVDVIDCAWFSVGFHIQQLRSDLDVLVEYADQGPRGQARKLRAAMVKAGEWLSVDGLNSELDQIVGALDRQGYVSGLLFNWGIEEGEVVSWPRGFGFGIAA